MNTTRLVPIMNHTRSVVGEMLLGMIPITTHRILDAENESSIGAKSFLESLSSSSYVYGTAGGFPYEAAIAAAGIGFFRLTVYSTNEPMLVRLFFSILLAALAYKRKTYELIVAVEIFSYFLSWILQHLLSKRQRKTGITASSSSSNLTKMNGNGNESISNTSSPTSVGLNRSTPYRTNLALEGSMLIAGGAGVSFILAHAITSGKLVKLLQAITPEFLESTIYYMFPIKEILAAYDVLQDYMPSDSSSELDNMLHYLFFVTFHIQCGMGFLGIEFLRQEQSRKNQLIRMDIKGTQEDDEEIVTNSTNSGHTGSNGTNEDSSNSGTSKKEQQQTTSQQDILNQRASRFQNAAGPFILFIAMPYMIQIITFGNMNAFAFSCVLDEMHRMVRVRQVFEHDNHLLAMSNETPVASSGYATSMNTVVTTVYDVFNRKFFSLPKICLLPTVMSRQPMLMVQVFPFIFLSDYIKAIVMSYMTTQIEDLQAQVKDLAAVRTKIESFDIKNAELLQRSGANLEKVRRFTQHRWELLTTQIQSKIAVSDLVRRSKDFFAFLQRNFVFAILIDCALAQLIAIGKIMTSEVFVFSRAIEDAVDLVLMRSRSEAELARMMTEINKLNELTGIWKNSRRTAEIKQKLHCRLQHHHPTTISTDGTTLPHRKSMIIRNLHYTRGTASARVDHLELHAGVYALTGANGSGKSTLFRIIMSCNTNEKVTDLPTSINLLTPSDPLTEEEDILREQACLEDEEEDETVVTNDGSSSCDSGIGAGDCPDLTNNAGIHQNHPIPKLSIVMPSSEVVEISQNFYWPLYAKPIDWIFEDHVSESYEPGKLESVVRKVAEELHSLSFFQQAQPVEPSGKAVLDEAIVLDPNSANTSTAREIAEIETSDAISAEAIIQRIMAELQEEKDDWFNNLSGGQKSKVELVRTVFLREHCPDVLLIDETMAPLDPASKELVMAKLKLFCHDSIIIVIYHTDVGLGKEIEGKTVDCVPSNNFFDKNIHLEKGLVHTRETC